MLKRLKIRNYAIIDDITIEFGPGLNILTGETGAGKSIIVGALSLLLGERISSGMLRKGTKRGLVEGEFDLSEYKNISEFELRTEKNTSSIILRREFTSSGASRGFVNGKSTTVQNIKRVFDGIIDLHGQHQHQSLLYPDNYYNIIDRFGKLTGLAEKTAASFNRLVSLQKEKNELERKESQLNEMRDYLEFQLKEINQVDPHSGEAEALEQEWKVLQNAETIVTSARECYKSLYDDEQSALAQIIKSQRALETLREYNAEIKNIEKDLAAASVSVEEAAKFLQQYSESIESNPMRLEEINQRLMSLRQLQKKYKTDIDGILDKKAEIEESLRSEESLAEEILEIKAEIAKELTGYGELCVTLSKKREQTAAKLQKKILERLKLLGMGNSLFDILVIKREKRGTVDGSPVVKADGKEYIGDENGIDEIQLRIATGKAERFLPISQIASGGELSRLMLAIKAVLMQADYVPTLIFDEIDTGISGRIAAAVGKELHNLAKFHQILCITHLPQIAGTADHHFSVRKVELKGRMVTRVAELDDDGRKREIAMLLTGDTVTDSHLKSAEEMIKKSR